MGVACGHYKQGQDKARAVPNSATLSSWQQGLNHNLNSCP